jgi:ATP-binding cassette subfamily F protein uup
MAPPLLFLREIRLTFGATPLLTSADLAVGAGERLCLVGRNGSGKSTLLKIAAGLVEADGGERFMQPGKTVRYLPQEPDFSGYETTLAYVTAGLAPGDDDYRAPYLLEMLGLTGREDPRTISGGEARRAALARTLAPEPDILLLDEPTNHLDLPAIEWLESELSGLRSALVLISHDRRFLENLSRATIWLDRGVTKRTDRGFGHFEAWRDDLLEQEERDQQKLQKRIEAGEHWMRYGVTARRKRNMRRVEELATMRKAQRDYRGTQGAVKLAASDAEVSGRLVAEAKGVEKHFGDHVVVRDLSLRLMRGDRLGIVGPNGAGKSTVLKLLTGELTPDAGSIRLGANLEMQVLDQRRASLDPTWTLAEALTDGKGDTVIVGGQSKHVIGYMRDFLFQPEQAGTAIGRLSGGERGRVMLARALAKPSNLLVLDEPTNDLDLETLDLLEELLAAYEGTVLLVSHDRDFLDRVCTSVLAFEGDARWVKYAGGYSDMVSQRGRGVEAREIVKAAAPRALPPTGALSSGAVRKLSFKDKHALETLPKEMEKRGREIAALRKTLDDPALYARQPDVFSRRVAELERAEAALAAAEEEWLRLELLREEIGATG